MSESGGFFKFFNINFRQTNAINLKFFTQALCKEHYSILKNLVVIKLIKYPNFEFKS